MPGTRPRADAFSARTGRPPRSVTKSSWRCSAMRRVVRDLAQALGELAAALAELAAQAAQRRRGRVLQVGAVLLDRAPDLLGDGEQRRVDPGHELHQHRDLVPFAERAARRHPGADRALDLRQRARVERAAAGREVGRLAHVGCAAEVGLGRLVEQRDRLGRLLLAQPHLVRRPPTGGGLRPAGLPARSPSPPASRARTAGSSSSSRSCSRMGRVYGRAARCIATRQGLRSRVVRYRNSLPQLDGTTAAHRRRHGDVADLRRRARAAVLRHVPAARERGGAGGDDRLLRAVSRRGPPSRHRLRARGEHVAGEPVLGSAARLLPRRARRGKPALHRVRGGDPRTRGRTGSPRRDQRPVGPGGRRVRPRPPHDGRRGGGVPLVAGRRPRGDGDRQRRRA